MAFCYMQNLKHQNQQLKRKKMADTTTPTKSGLTQKQIDRLVLIGYAGIVLAYGVLLMVKLSHKTTK